MHESGLSFVILQAKTCETEDEHRQPCATSLAKCGSPPLPFLLFLYVLTIGAKSESLSITVTEIIDLHMVMIFRKIPPQAISRGRHGKTIRNLSRHAASRMLQMTSKTKMKKSGKGFSDDLGCRPF